MFSKHMTNCEVSNLMASISHARSTRGNYMLLTNKQVIGKPRLKQTHYVYFCDALPVEHVWLVLGVSTTSGVSTMSGG